MERAIKKEKLGGAPVHGVAHPQGYAGEEKKKKKKKVEEMQR